MKPLITLTFGLIAGFGIGWYVAYSLPAAKANRDANQLFKTMEWDDSLAAIFAVRAIPMVESGDVTNAVAWLAKPIGSYYRVYAHKAGTNEDRLALCAKIEQLAGTNPAVAAEIHRKIQ